ncbi:MAG: guanylate kinase [Proteobacteria bacterium]|nr:MAG: guanylate kinase [Pseudomonadota bacterium]
MKQGQLYIVSAPSGAGKTSLLNALRGQLKYVTVAVSHTTRPPRSGEKEGWHYHFVSVEAFRQEIDYGNFLEYAQVFDNYYGSNRVGVEQLLDAGKDVILEIDWQGARQVRKVHPDIISIFILPPSQAALEERLRSRKQDNEATIQRRMRDARSEMSHYPEYDYLIINDDFEDALEELLAIFRSGRLRLDRQVQHRKDLLDSLTGN